MGEDTFGRDAEIASLDAFLEQVETGPRAFVLQGEAGIGKTTVWRAAVERGDSRGYRVLEARPAEAEAQLAFAGVTDLVGAELEDAAASLPEPQVRALEVALLLRPEDETPPNARAVATACLGIVRALATDAPVLVAVDDAHWLDPASAATIQFVARRLRSERVGLLIALRAHESLPLDMGPSLPTERLSLGPLSLGALHRLVQERLSTVLTRPALRRLSELSGGNPFYALELARAYAEGTIQLAHGEPLPGDLGALTMSRLARLPVETRDVLAAAAASRRPTLRLLGVTFPDADAEATLEPAADAEVVRIAGEEIGFVHPLLASAAYGSVSGRRRRELHRRLADAADEIEERARHLALAADGPDEQIAGAVEDAARSSFRRGAPASAAELAADSRRLTPDSEGASARRRALAEADYRFESGDTERAAALIEELVATSPAGAERARLLSRLSRIRHFADDVGGGVELLRAALSEAGDEPALRAEIEEGLAWGLLLMRHDLPAAADHARSAAELAAEPAALAEALAIQALTEFALGRDAEATMARALALEAETLHLRVLRHPRFAHGYLLSCADRVGEAREAFAQLHARALERGDESALPPILNHLALVECLAGRYDEALAHADAGYALALQSGQRPTQASILAKTALVQARRGAADAARDAAERSLATAAGGQFDLDRADRVLSRGGETALWALARVELSAGAPEQAARLLEPLERTLLTAGVRDPGELRFLPDAVEAHTGVGDLEEAERLAGFLNACADAVKRPSALGAAARCAGLLAAAQGDQDRALTLLETARDEFETTELPFERAQTLLALGEAQRRAKQRRTARETLERARREFDLLGAAPWADAARAALGRIGGRSASDGLTATQQRVADLVLEGRSNKEIATALFVTAKTVETQLSRIYAKLGVHSRTELARHLAGKE